jgi:serine/threonine protein kinase
MLGRIALGKYKLQRRLGHGSNAEVFLADLIDGSGQPVVVKRVYPHVVAHPKFRRLFEAEVRSMANFSHPYIVGFIEASLDDPIGPCLVMEYVPGITLEAMLRRHRVVDLERTGRLLGQLCHALQAAHDAGVIHRDLKPANLMVANAGSVRESLKVMDFGFAGFAAKPHIQLAELTGQGPIHAMGTPGYVSPEMIRGDVVDWRSDLYCVGVILFEMITGKLPFDSEFQEKLLAAHVDDPPPRFARVGAKNIPPEVEAVVQLALSKYPNERQQSAREVASMFGQAIGVDLLEATRPVGWEPPLPVAEVYNTPAPRTAPDLPADPFQVAYRFEIALPERMAAAKLKGFVDDMGGEVLASEPGLIRMRLGVPKGFKEAPQGGSALFNWFRTIRQPAVPRGQEPIEVELQMEKPDPGQARLNVVVAFHPLKEYPPPSPSNWRDRCEKLNATLRRYLGA